MWRSVQVSDHDYAKKEKRAWNAPVLQKMAPLPREAVFTEQGSDHDQVVRISGISCRIDSIFMNNLRHEDFTKIP
jgi:hypothetical protein